jgi:hypothetical protein
MFDTVKHAIYTVNMKTYRPAKDVTVGVRLPENIKEALQQQAAREYRTLSSLVESVLTEWLRTKKLVR